MNADDRPTTDVLDSMDQVLKEAVPSQQSRRTLMARAGGLLAAGATLAYPAAAGAAGGSMNSVLSLLTTYETFGVTLLSNAVRLAPGTPSAAFASVVMAANTTEFAHLQALKGLGGRTLATKFWIPDAVLDGGLGLFTAVAAQEEVEISAYLVGVTQAARKRDAKVARLFAEALGTESEHRVLARNAAAFIAGTGGVAPNNRGFEAFPYHTAASALKASKQLGLGFGEQGALPGKFYTFPGDPLKNGTGTVVETYAPA